MRTIALTAVLGMLLACGDDKNSEKKTPESGNKKPVSALAAVMATAPIGEGMSVAKAKETKTADEAIVTGRISKIVGGYAAFNMTDVKLEYCGQVRREDDCLTPWDYCCIPGDEQVANRMSVAVYDGEGGIIRTMDLGGLRLLDVVSVKGKLVTDENGNTSLHATTIHRDERPKLRDGLNWPE
ncbi:MAG: hypothetical protein ACYTGZ_02875 [Planctomycetota bacterium]|jgi:hypothetical protein